MKTMKQIAIIIPTRGRPSNIHRLHEQWFKITDTSIQTDCIIVLDHDDEHNYPRLEGFRYIVVHNTIRGVVYPLNQAAMSVLDEYEYLGFWGDDHFPITENWNTLMYSALKRRGLYSMVYGDDGIQGIKLPTHIVMDARLIRELGYMGHPSFQHLYVDDFWKYVGTTLGTLEYMDHVKIEHRHYCNQKAPFDELYAINNSGEAFNSGHHAFTTITQSVELQNKLQVLCIRGLRPINILNNLRQL